jgi:SAM-dependent methyltransferase
MVTPDVAQRNYLDELAPFIDPKHTIVVKEGIPSASFVKDTPGLRANAYYFGQPEWAAQWLNCVHRDTRLRERWHATGGTWDNKIVVDVGCGPGNLQATIGDKPKTLIGVDVSLGSLQLAKQIGYIPLLADAHGLPLKSGIADVVALNATIHHCDEMETVLAEAARLVKPGGVLIADHDPHLPAYDFRWLGKLLWKLRLIVYQFLNRGGHRKKDDEQAWAEATEIHHQPGDGLSANAFKRVLEPMGFDVKLYPHNHLVGREILDGAKGRAKLKMRMAQRLSGIDPDSDNGALSLLCVARKMELPL